MLSGLNSDDLGKMKSYLIHIVKRDIKKPQALSFWLLSQYLSQ